jgi:hypothetical protein
VKNRFFLIAVLLVFLGAGGNLMTGDDLALAESPPSLDSGGEEREFNNSPRSLSSYGGDPVIPAPWMLLLLGDFDLSGWTRLLGTSSSDKGEGIAVDSGGNSHATGSTEGDLDGKSNEGGSDIFIAKYDAAGNKQWVNLLGTSSSDKGEGIAVDSGGNSYLTGSTEGHLDGEINAGQSDIFIAKYDAAGNKQWVRLLGSSLDENELLYDYGKGIAVDSGGNSYVTGNTEGDLDGEINAGQSDIFIAKYDTDGNKQWVRLLGTSSWDYGECIAVDSSGNSYVTGYTNEELDEQDYEGEGDIFIAKYDTNGNKQWVRLLGTPSLDRGSCIAVDSGGNSYITGHTAGNLDGQMKIGSYDIFIAKYDTDGNKQWVRLLGSSLEDDEDLNDYGKGIAVDSGGNSYIAGNTEGDLDGQLNAGSHDIFAAKYDKDGNRQWVILLGTSLSDFGEGIAIDPYGSSYITGNTKGDLDGNDNAGHEDIVITKIPDVH